MPAYDGSERLTKLPGILVAMGFLVPDYRILREMAINAEIPAHQVNGIWHFFKADALTIANTLNLRRTTDQRAA